MLNTPAADRSLAGKKNNLTYRAARRIENIKNLRTGRLKTGEYRPVHKRFGLFHGSVPYVLSYTG
jgi:hypothetical protein